MRHVAEQQSGIVMPHSKEWLRVLTAFAQRKPIPFLGFCRSLRLGGSARDKIRFGSVVWGADQNEPETTSIPPNSSPLPEKQIV
jgi:hypothetical protein